MAVAQPKAIASFWLLAICTLQICACGAAQEEVDALRKDVVRLRAEARQARKEAARAREEVGALNLKAEVQAYLQRDPSLRPGAALPALDARIESLGRGFGLVISSLKTARAPQPISLPPDVVLRLDFVAGSGSVKAVGDRLEVSTRDESFVPLSVSANSYNAYVLDEGRSFTLKTRRPTSSAVGAARRRGPAKGRAPDTAELLLRYLPADGPHMQRVAYVRLLFLPTAEAARSVELPPASSAPGEASSEDPGDPEGPRFDFSEDATDGEEAP